MGLSSAETSKVLETALAESYDALAKKIEQEHANALTRSISNMSANEISDDLGKFATALETAQADQARAGVAAAAAQDDNTYLAIARAKELGRQLEEQDAAAAKIAVSEALREADKELAEHPHTMGLAGAGTFGRAAPGHTEPESIDKIRQPIFKGPK